MELLLNCRTRSFYELKRLLFSRVYWFDRFEYFERCCSLGRRRAVACWTQARHGGLGRGGRQCALRGHLRTLPVNGGTMSNKATCSFAQLRLQFVFVAAIQFRFKDAPTIVLSSQTVSASAIRSDALINRSPPSNYLF